MKALLLGAWASAAASAPSAAPSKCHSRLPGCQSPWSLLQIHSARTTQALPHAPAGDVLTDLAEDGQACRGADAEDNSESYFEAHMGLDSLGACKELCIAAAECKGIEYSLGNSGRCEVWTRREGIGAVRSMAGFSCLRFRREFELVDGVGEGACRGANATDNSPYYYATHKGVSSLAECKALCLSTRPFCTGIEYTSSLAGGRCEVWTRPEGVGMALPMAGFSCLRLRSIFEPVQSDRGRPAAPTPLPQPSPAPSPAPASAGSAIERTLTAGADYIFSSERTDGISVIGMTETSAIVCSLTQRRGYCSVLAMSGGSWTQGPEVGVADQGETGRLSIARLSETTALVCYVENGVGVYGRPISTPTCRALTTSGTSTVRGTPFVLDDQEEVILSMSIVGLSPSLALVCYNRLDDAGLVGLCSAMHVDGGELRQDTAVEVSAGDLEYGPEIVAAKLSGTTALVCHRNQHIGERAACNVFSVSSAGQTSKGSALAISDSHFHSLSAAGISETRAVVCFKDFAVRPPQSVCKDLAVSGTDLAEVQHVQVVTGRTSLARLSDDSALVCSSDTHHKHQTACAVLNLGGGALTKGPDLLLSTTNTGSMYVAAGLSPADGLVCYEDRTYAKEHKGACMRLAVTTASP